MGKYCDAPRCIGKLEGELVFNSPRGDPERFRIWADFIGANVEKKRYIYLCSKHFERKYISFLSGTPYRLLKGARPIPTIPCQGPDKDPCTRTTHQSTVSMIDSQSPDTQVSSQEVATQDLNGSLSDVIVRGLSEAVRLNTKFEIKDDYDEEFQSEIPMERYESFPDVPQSNTQRIIRHGNQDKCHIIEELSELYSLITLPYLEQANLNLQWVYKILSGEEGCERIVYESPNKDDKDGFMLIRDSKWDGINLDNLHLIAIAYRPGIMSLRDLGRKHLRLLHNIYLIGKDVIMKKYDVVASQLCIFLQYIPSFYHLHVNFTAMNEGICGPHYGTVHSLHSVIHNIQICSTYYQDAPLSLCLKESDELFQRFEAQGIVKRIQPSS